MRLGACRLHHHDELMKSPRPNRRAVEAAKNAPPDFGTKDAIAYVGRDPSDR
jgi:hypothetical protein